MVPRPPLRFKSRRRSGIIERLTHPRPFPMKLPLPLSLAALALCCTAACAAGPVDGEVRKIDAAQGKLTLRHAEIKALDIPAMTRAYKVQDASALGTLAVGDAVRFSIEKIDGSYTITQVQKAR